MFHSTSMKPGRQLSSWLLLIAWLTSVLCQDIDEDMLYYEILEEPQPGTFIANIFADAGIGNKYESTELELLQFRFLAPPELGFTMERDTGILRASSAIDRDATCPQLDVCTFRLDVVALIPDPLRFLEIIKVTVRVDDLNDNSPVFPESYISHPVLESATLGRIVVISTASDPDSGQNGIQSYELLSTSAKFALEINEKLDGSSELELILIEELDRELEDYYNMKVIAYDGGDPPLSGSVDVTITVMDTNDHDPIFENSTYEVSVEENFPLYDSILRVHANDGDTGLYGKIIYGFSASSLSTNGYLFGINNDTGDIYLKDMLDYEQGHIYHLTVTAQDQGPDSLTADTTVIIRVSDVNDNTPQITVNTLAATGTDLAEIAENAEMGTFVAHINVVDPDSGLNGEFNCSLSDSHFRLQQLYANEYQIITRAYLDRETMPSYNLALLCQDYGIDSQVAIKHIEVAVIDVNDNTPLFRQPSYSANLIENHPVGTFLVQLNATDQDAGRNAQIEYTLQEDLTDLFHVEPSTGIITTNAVLDHEQAHEFQMRVYATDHGTPRRNSTALLVVYIQDENDERPIFSQDAYSFGVSENYPANSEVGLVHASDADSFPNNQLQFSLLSNEDHSFSIDRHTGRITTRVTLDRERQPVYLLIVVATDNGQPSAHTSSVSVSVYVDDENDHAPVVLFPTVYNNTVHVSSQAPLGHIITRIQAMDDDIGRNANLTYWFSRGNERGWLRLDPLTGRLSVNRDLGNIDYEIYDVEILVQDQGEPRQNAFTNLNVIVNKSIPFYFQEQDSLLGSNFTIVISVACVSGILAVILVCCIIFMLRQKDNEQKNHKYVDAMKVLSVQETNEKNEKELNNMKSVTLSEPGATTITVDIDNGYVSKPQTLHTSVSPHVANFDGDITPTKDVADSPPSLTPAHAMALRSTGSRDGHSQEHAHTSSGRTTPQNDVQINKMPQFRRGDPETDSTSSAEGSNADSGRGPSEEGDQSKSSADPNNLVPAAGARSKPQVPHVNGDIPTQGRIPFRPNTGTTGRNVTFAKTADVRGCPRSDSRGGTEHRLVVGGVNPAQRTVAMAARDRRKYYPPHIDSQNGNVPYNPGYHSSPRSYHSGLIDPRQPRTSNYGSTRDFQRPPKSPQPYPDPRSQYVVRLDGDAEISNDVMV